MSHVGGHKKFAAACLKLVRDCSLWPIRKIYRPKGKP